jgi:hypothetical protein
MRRRIEVSVSRTFQHVISTYPLCITKCMPQSCWKISRLIYIAQTRAPRLCFAVSAAMYSFAKFQFTADDDDAVGIYLMQGLQFAHSPSGSVRKSPTRNTSVERIRRSTADRAVDGKTGRCSRSESRSQPTPPSTATPSMDADVTTKSRLQDLCAGCCPQTQVRVLTMLDYRQKLVTNMGF